MHKQIVYLATIVILFLSCTDNKTTKKSSNPSKTDTVSATTTKGVLKDSVSQISTSNVDNNEIQTLEFKVSDVTIAKELLITNDSKKIFENKVEKKILYLPQEHSHKQLVVAYNNGLIETLQTCYDQHRPLVLTPDVIWLAITQGAAIHINENYKELEHIIFNDNKPKKLIIRNDSLQYGGKHWEHLIESLAKEASQHTKDDYYSFFVPKFSTTDKTCTTAYQITLLNSYKKAFVYVGESGCGIPYIRLKGNKEDWEMIYKNLESLDKIGLTDWKNELKPVIKEFINIYEGKINTEFWQSIYKNMTDYNAFYISGWIIKFFPYLEDIDNGSEGVYDPKEQAVRYDKNFVKNKLIYGNKHFLSTLSTDDFPSGIVDVNVIWNDYYNETTKTYNIYSGFFAIKQEKDKSLEPVISWAISDKNAKKVSHKIKYSNGGSPDHNNDSYWTPYIMEKLAQKAIYNPMKFNDYTESIAHVKQQLLEALTNNFDELDFYNQELSFVVLSNGKIENVTFIGNKKIETFIKNFLNTMPHKWFPALSKPSDVIEMWDEWGDNSITKLKVNSEIKLVLNNDSAPDSTINDEDETIDWSLDEFVLQNYKEPTPEEIQALVANKLQKDSLGNYNLENLKEIYEKIFPKNTKLELDNILSEEDDMKYFNSGGWNNNTKHTILMTKHKVYYIFVSEKNKRYQQLVFSNNDNDWSIPKNGQIIYDDSYLKFKDGHWETFGKIVFNPKMAEGKYLVFTKVITEKGNTFFSNVIDTINYKKPLKK